jgi:hypothetical protein
MTSDQQLKKIRSKIASYRGMLGASAPTIKAPSKEKPRAYIYEIVELDAHRTALLRKNGRPVSKDLRDMRKTADTLLRSLSSQTSPRKIAAAQAKVSTLRAALVQNASRPVVRAKIVAENPAILSAADDREVLVNTWTALKDPKAKTAFFRQHQSSLRSWIREMAEKGLTVGR